MLTDFSAERFDFGMVGDRPVEAAFSTKLVARDAGALFLVVTDRVLDWWIGLQTAPMRLTAGEMRAGHATSIRYHGWL